MHGVSVLAVIGDCKSVVEVVEQWGRKGTLNRVSSDN